MEFTGYGNHGRQERNSSWERDNSSWDQAQERYGPDRQEDGWGRRQGGGPGEERGSDVQVTVSRAGGCEMGLKGGISRGAFRTQGSFSADDERTSGFANSDGQFGSRDRVGNSSQTGGREAFRRERSNRWDRDGASSVTSTEGNQARVRRDASNSSGGSRNDPRGGSGRPRNERRHGMNEVSDRRDGNWREGWEPELKEGKPRAGHEGHRPQGTHAKQNVGGEGSGWEERETGSGRESREGIVTKKKSGGRYSGWEDTESLIGASATHNMGSELTGSGGDEASRSKGLGRKFLEGEVRLARDDANANGRQSLQVLASASVNYGSAVDFPKGPMEKKQEVGKIKEREAIPARATPVYDEAEIGMGSEGSTLPCIVGTCPDMCPARERELRERLRDLAVWERLNGSLCKTSAELAVKKFCRTFSSTDIQPSDVRPLPVLWRTLHYLLRLLDSGDFPFEVAHSFLFDRTRAIRQELGMQRISNGQAIHIYEDIVRFHIFSERELSAAPGKKVDSQLNLQQLSKSLFTLLNMYAVEDSKYGLQNEAEFHCYYVLLNLGNRDHFKGEPLSLWFRSVPHSVLRAPEMLFARKVLRCYRMDCYKGFFSLVRKATYLQACLMELFFNQARLVALEALNVGGYKLHPYPLAKIAELLLMEESNVEEMCRLCGLSTGVDSTSKAPSLLVKQSSFKSPANAELRYWCFPISHKRATSQYEEITLGGKL